MEMVVRSKKSAPRDSRLQREIDRCRREIAQLEHEIREGHPDVAGLCLALRDWSAELRILEGQHAGSS